MANVSVTKAKPLTAPKITLPKAKVPKMNAINKVPKPASMNGYKGASKMSGGLKGAISKNNLAQVSKAAMNQGY